jgi:3-phenylpropionate/cinnamic acid dioxygenase small subunit
MMDGPETLWDLRLIEQQYFRYCEIIDAKDFDALEEIFLAEAVQDYRSSNGILQNGVAPLIARLHVGMGRDSDCGATQHNVCNVRAAVTGDRAVAKAHFYAVHAGRNRYDGEIYRCWGQYDDIWQRTSAGWRIARRDYVNFLTEGPVAIIRATGRPMTGDTAS